MANLPPVLKQYWTDADGNPLAGGKIYTYQAGTSTPQATYTDQGGLTANANPVVLDASGWAAMWLDPSLSYKFVVKDSSDATIHTIDNVVGLLGEGAVVTGSLADGVLSADATGLAKMADGYLAATAAGRAKMADGFLSADAAGRAKMADGFLSADAAGQAKVADGFLSADAAGRAKMADGFLTHAKLAARATGTTVAVGGVAISAGSGLFSTSSTTFVDVTNLSVTITTTGRPVWIGLIRDPDITSTFTAYLNGSSTDAMYTQFMRDATSLGTVALTSFSHVISSVSAIDTPAAGTYTYKLQARMAAGTGEVRYAKLIVFEL